VPRKKSSKTLSAADLLEVSLVGIIVFLVVYFFVGELLQISGTSMHPTLQDGERMISEKLSLKFRELERGEVVIFSSPKSPKRLKELVVKRVVGLPGESLRISKGRVYINGNILEERYLDPNEITEIDPATPILDAGVAQSTASSEKLHIDTSEMREGETYEIPDNAYVLMGDNRDQSRDSRDWGAISRDNIVGRALLVYYPISKFRRIK
jgi:signal peptidase I